MSGMYSVVSRMHVQSIDAHWRIRDIHWLLRQRLEGMCTKQHGFYMEVLDINIKTIVSSVRGRLIVHAACKIRAFLPVEGAVYDARVEDCFDQRGVQCAANGRLVILIPFRYLTAADYSYDDAGGAFHNGTRTIAPGDFARVKIEKTRYQNGQYRAIGRLE